MAFNHREAEKLCGIPKCPSNELRQITLPTFHVGFVVVGVFFIPQKLVLISGKTATVTISTSLITKGRLLRCAEY